MYLRVGAGVGIGVGLRDWLRIPGSRVGLIVGAEVGAGEGRLNIPGAL